MTDARAGRPGRWAQLSRSEGFDVLVVGGGATGLGVALDAAARGWSVALVEANDFAKGTSSRATKLVHGGVRYLAQGNLSLVREALSERAMLLTHASHLAQPLAFVMPSYRMWETPFYGMGLKLYDAMAGAKGLGNTRWLGAAATVARLPGVRRAGLRGGVEYWDGQFDDARFAIALARTAAEQGALVLNHVRLMRLVHEGGKVQGAQVRDEETGRIMDIKARCVVNATGVWVDDVMGLDRPSAAREANASSTADNTPAMVAPSQGVHLVVDRSFLPGDRALMVPKTQDGRVLFAVPWLGKVILGTTDTPVELKSSEPTPRDDEVAFILKEAGRYLERQPERRDVLSAWAGLRPLVRPEAMQAATGATSSTKSLSREHTILVSASGLVTVTGGKWTTYRAMAEDVLARCMDAKLLDRREPGATLALRLVGAPLSSMPTVAPTPSRFGASVFGASGQSAHSSLPAFSLADPPGSHLYGDEASLLMSLPGAENWLWRDGRGGLSEAMVRFAVRFEMARCVEDVLARRSRLLFLDAASASAVAENVATIVAQERGLNESAGASVVGLSAFRALARQYGRVGASAR
jgi:glycerol-3-phosphate dehydrogenase